MIVLVYDRNLCFCVSMPRIEPVLKLYMEVKLFSKLIGVYVSKLMHQWLWTVDSVQRDTAAVKILHNLYFFFKLYLYLYLLYFDLAVDSSEGRDQCAHTEPLQLGPQPPH